MKEVQWTIILDTAKIQEKTDNEQWGTVYAIEFGGYLKIGQTKNLVQRITALIHQTR
jgi:hypothetical protein